MYDNFKDKEKRIEYLRIWRLNHREQINRSVREWYKKKGRQDYIDNREEKRRLILIHNKVRSMWGRACRCDMCHDETKTLFQWSNKDHKYSMEREDWQMLCPSCHSIYDMNHNGKWGHIK